MPWMAARAPCGNGSALAGRVRGGAADVAGPNVK